MTEEAWRRAALAMTRRSAGALARALEAGETPDDGALARAEEALEARGLRPWVPPDPAAGPVLFLRGEAPPEGGVAVVGARAADAYGLACARRVAEDAAALGRAVVSGGAEGCDAEAHRAALEAGGLTVVVLGSGHDHPWPTAHRRLFDRVVDHGGAVVSPWWPAVPPARHRFLARNGVIAALAAATVVVRADLRSGALSTARAARALGRPVLAVPGDVGQRLSGGCHALLAAGAAPLAAPRDLARALGARTDRRWPVGHAGAPAPWDGREEAEAGGGGALPAALEGAAAAVVAWLDAEGPSDLDRLVAGTGLGAGRLTATLLDLEVAGVVEALPGLRYRAAARLRS